MFTETTSTGTQGNLARGFYLIFSLPYLHSSLFVDAFCVRGPIGLRILTLLSKLIQQSSSGLLPINGGLTVHAYINGCY